MNKLRQQKETNAALGVVIRIWIIMLAILAVPALGAVIVGLNQCKDPGCSARTSQIGQPGVRERGEEPGRTRPGCLAEAPSQAADCAAYPSPHASARFAAGGAALRAA